VSLGIEEVLRLSEQYRDCQLCPALVKSRTQVVFGGGSASAPIFVLGEAPGADEDEAGVPFWGRSGRLLMDMLIRVWPETERAAEILAMEPDQSLDDQDAPYFEALRDYLDDYVFWANIVCCRPEENRNPGNSEVKACRDRLNRTIYAVDPLLILAMGKIAISTLLGKVVPVSSKRGTIYDVAVPSPVTGHPVRYPAMALLHPSFLLRKGDQALVPEHQGETHKTVEDLRCAIHLLDAEYRSLYDSPFPERP